MVLHLTGRGVPIPSALRRRVDAKIAKMQRLLPKLVEARVVLATERHRHLVDVTLQAKGAVFHGEAAASDFHAALDQALAHLGEQVRRRKERITGHKAAGPARTRRRAAGAATGETGEHAAGPPVAIRRTSAKPMSLEEAIDQLRLQTDGLLVFRNARTRVVNVLRRRADGAMELVEPIG